MEMIYDSGAIMIQSDVKGGPPCRGIRRKGAQSTAGITKRMILRSVKVQESEDEGIGDSIDFHRPLNPKPVKCKITKTTNKRLLLKATPIQDDSAIDCMEMSISNETSLHRPDTLDIGMSVDITDAETSSGVSCRSSSNSPTLELSENPKTHLQGETTLIEDSDSDVGTTPWRTRMENAARKYKPRDTSSEPESLEDSEMTGDHDYIDFSKTQRKYRKKFLLRKSKPTPTAVLTPKNISSNITQKRRKSSLSRACDSSDVENYPQIDNKPASQRKRRRLYCSDSTEDSSELQDTSDKPAESADRFNKVPSPEMMETSPAVIPSALNRSSRTLNPSITSKNISILFGRTNEILNSSQKPKNSTSPQEKSSVVVIDDDPADDDPEFTEFEALDEEMLLDVDFEVPSTNASQTLSKNPSEPSTSTIPVDRPMSPDEFEALELYQPDEDVDVGWKTDDDFSDGDVPQEVRSTTRVTNKNTPAASANTWNNPSTSAVTGNDSPPQPIKINDPYTYQIFRNNCPSPPKKTKNTKKKPKNIPYTLQNYRDYDPSPPKPSRRNNGWGWGWGNNRRGWGNNYVWRKKASPPQPTRNTKGKPQTVDAVFKKATKFRRGRNNQQPLASEDEDDNSEDDSDVQDSSNYSEDDSDYQSPNDDDPTDSCMTPEVKPKLNDAFNAEWLDYTLPKAKRGKRRYGEKTRKEGRETVEAIKVIHSQLQSKPDDEERVVAPSGMRVRLLQHQEHALAWMQWRERSVPAGGMLADDMGLGKTITAIALIMKGLEEGAGRPSCHDNAGGTLIVCPANLIPQWKQEIQSRAEIEDVELYHLIKEKNITKLRRNEVVITSYDTLANCHKTHQQILFKIYWKRVILDEAHVVRNHKTLRSECVAKLLTEKRWALTGTPIHNKVKDIFPIMRFLQLRPFHDSKHFNKWIANNDAAGTARLHCVMEAVMLRRTKEALVKAGLMPELPLKTNLDIPIVVEPEERLVYDKVMIYSRTLFIQFLHQRKENEMRKALGPDYRINMNSNTYELTPAQIAFLERRGNISRHHILTLILRLRQICCHPALIMDMLEQEDFEEAGVDNLPANQLKEANKKILDDLEEFGEIGVNEEVVLRRILTKDNPVFNRDSVSSKMIAVLERVKEIIRKGEKVIIVSDWVGYLNIIGHHLDDIKDATWEAYTGSTPYGKREDIVHRFNHTDETMVLLLSLRAGGQGLNLKGANHVILVDVHWNPQLEVQAQDRVYRIGQGRNVFIHKFVCQNTIEERIVALQENKLRIAEAVLSGSKHEVRRLELSEMCSLFNL